MQITNRAYFWQLEGWEDFDKRRRLKLQKQLDFRAGGSAEFDEGADKSFWERKRREYFHSAIP